MFVSLPSKELFAGSCWEDDVRKCKKIPEKITSSFLSHFQVQVSTRRGGRKKISLNEENGNRNDKTVGNTLISRLANSPPKLVHWKWSSGFIATIDLAIVTLQSTHHLVIWGNDCLPPITSYLWHKLWYDFQLYLNLIVFFINFGCLQYLTHFPSLTKSHDCLLT